MRKEDFLKLLNCEDSVAAVKLYDKLSIAQKSGKTLCTSEFYTPDLWSKLLELKSSFNMNIYCNGVFEEAERRIIAFNTESEDYSTIKLICIKNKSKFHDLKHKDYLGAIMSLGIKREKIGDLIVDEDKCYSVVCEDICSYIIENLDYIAHCPCNVSEVYDYESIPNYKFEEKTIIATSMRADCIVSAITGLSRSKSVDIINSGKVLINYVNIREKDFEVMTKFTVTIRGYGKFKIGETIGNSSSGRLKVLVKKFV